MKTEEGEITLAKVSVQDGKGCEKILKVEVSRDSIQKEYDEFYKAIAAEAKVPGFRPGKAPRNVLELHYSQEARGKVLEHLVSESYRQAIKEKGLFPLGYPDVEQVEFDNNKLTYQARIETRPKIKLSKITGLNAKKEKAEVKPEEIDEALKRLQETSAQFKVVEDRASQMGDFLIADYVCVAEGKEVEKRADEWFELKEEEFLKGFSAQLTGAKAGDQREVNVTFPEKFSHKNLAGKPAVFKVSVKEIKTKSLPAIDDELAKAAGEFQNLQELKDRIKADVLENKQKELEIRYERALLDELIKHNKIELPEGVVKRRLEHLIEKAAHHGHNHAPGDKHTHDIPAEVREKLSTELAPEARRQVHLAFLLDEIASKENLTVGEADLKEKFQQIAAEVRQPVEAVEKYYGQNEEARESLADQLQSEKAVEFLKKNAKE